MGSGQARDLLFMRIGRVTASVAAVGAATFVAYRLAPVNATTVGFAYLLIVLVIAGAWGLLEAVVASIAATLCFNFYFLPPIGTFTVADPQNWVALFTFLATALIASRLSTNAKARALDAIERQEDLERLYTFSRAILLIDTSQNVASQLARKVSEVFGFSGVVLFERASARSFATGLLEAQDLDQQLHAAALQGTSFFDSAAHRTVVAVRLGADPIGSLAVQGAPVQDSVLQGIANLVAIGLERANAQQIASQLDAARQSEELKSALIDATAHEFKTPLTSIKAVTTALLSQPGLEHNGAELVKIADEEADRLNGLVDDAIEMARVDSGQFRVSRRPADLRRVVAGVLAEMHTQVDERRIQVAAADRMPPVELDPRLFTLALKQVLDNALKYSPQDQPIEISIEQTGEEALIVITDHGKGIPTPELGHVFDRFYRGPDVKHRIPGSGLGLSIARVIIRAHQGNIEVSSHPGETTFRITLPLKAAKTG